MTDASNPQQGVASAINDLGEQTAALVRSEIEAVREEMVGRAKQWAPALGLMGVSASAGVFAGASVYRLAARMMDKLFPPVLSSLVTGVGFAALAVVASTKAIQMIRGLPAPVPARTASTTAASLAAESRS